MGPWFGGVVLHELVGADQRERRRCRGLSRCAGAGCLAGGGLHPWLAGRWRLERHPIARCADRLDEHYAGHRELERQAASSSRSVVSLSSPYTVPVGTSIVLKAAAFALWPSSVMHGTVIGPVATVAPAMPTAPVATYSRWFHVSSNTSNHPWRAGAIQSVVNPVDRWSNTEVAIPLDAVDSSLTISGVRVYMAQTPTGTPTYDLWTDMLGPNGFSGLSVHRWDIDIDIVRRGSTCRSRPAIAIPGPIHLHARTNAGSTTSIGAIRLTIAVPAS